MTPECYPGWLRQTLDDVGEQRIIRTAVGRGRGDVWTLAPLDRVRNDELSFEFEGRHPGRWASMARRADEHARLVVFVEVPATHRHPPSIAASLDQGGQQLAHQQIQRSCALAYVLTCTISACQSARASRSGYLQRPSQPNSRDTLHGRTNPNRMGMAGARTRSIEGPGARTPSSHRSSDTVPVSRVHHRASAERSELPAVCQDLSA